MSKTTIKELALSLSEKHDLNKADAERFVATIFEVINNGLEDDKLVKVKGLGAFKIIGIAARKSVDVNTGEPIVIEGRNKISFTPDASMRDDVNKPFSQFETVVINDGVDFSSIDKEYENDDEIASEKETEIRPKTVADDTNKTEETTIKEGVAISEPDVEPSTSSISPISQKPIEEDSLLQEELTGNIDGEKENIKSESIKNIDSENKENKKKATPDENNATKQDRIEKELSEDKEAAIESRSAETKVDRKLIDDEKTHPNHALKTLIIIAVVIVIGCLCGGYYLFSQIQRRDSHIEMLEKQMRLVAQHQKKGQGTSKPNIQTRKAQQAQDSIPSKADSKQEAIKQETSQTEDKQTALQDQYNKDVRIRTGAYVIVGIKKTVTVRSGQTMDGISRSNLGPGMECYLEAVNGGKRELKAGESINIPELKLKKRLR